MLELTVKTLDSQNHSFTVPDETTVLQLKESIRDKLDVPVENQRLIFHGKVLQNDKKLADYGVVNEKVLHLVQWAPPSASSTQGSSSRTTADEQAGQTPPRRTVFGRTRRLDPANATYLGAVALPAELMDAQGMMQPLPMRLVPSHTRLALAIRLLVRADILLNRLESQNSPAGEQAAAAGSATDPLADAAAAQETSRLFVGETSITQAAQAATAAAIAAAVTAAQAAVLPGITILNEPLSASQGAEAAAAAAGSSDAAQTSVDAAASTSTLSDLNIDHETHPEDVVAVEVEIGASTDVILEERQDTSPMVDTSGEAPPRGGELTSTYVDFVTRLDSCQRRFQPLLLRCRQLMEDDPTFSENSSPTAEECQRLFDGVSETMHYLAHVYHALSDIMVDFNEDVPRTLRCRPVLRQHSAILEAGFPMQINLRRTAANNNTADSSNANLNNNAQAAQAGTTQTGTAQAGNAQAGNAQAGAAQSHPQPQQLHDRLSQIGGLPTIVIAPQLAGRPQISVRATGGLPEDPFADIIAGVEAQRSSATAAAAAASASAAASAAAPPTGSERTVPENSNSFVLATPGNVEIFMDFGPDGLTMGSVETTVIRGTSDAARGALHAAANSRASLIQSAQAVAGFFQNRFLRADGTPTPTAVASSSSDDILALASQASGSGGAEARREEASPTPPRPHIHMGSGGLRGLDSMPFDPLLPCTSHHSRPFRQRRRNTSTPQPATAQPATAQPSASRPAGTRRGAAANTEFVEDFLTFMANMLAPDRIMVPRGGPVTVGPNFRPDALEYDPGRWWLYQSLQESRPIPNSDATEHVPIANFLHNMIETAHVEGESISSDFLMTLARNLTWPDLTELSRRNRGREEGQRNSVEGIINRMWPALNLFVRQRLLGGEDSPTESAMAAACERIYSELRPYFEATMHGTRLRESVDLSATINNYNQTQLPEILGLILNPGRGSFGHNMMRRVTLYVRQLVAIIVHCCQDGTSGLDSIVRSCVRLMVHGINSPLRQWTEVNSVNHVRSYAATLDVPLEDIQRYLVYRIPSTTQDQRGAQAVDPRPEPMDTDTPHTESVLVATESVPLQEKVEEEPIAETLVAMETENLPDVLIGSESWHNALPSDWVPIIARDAQRQRRQNSNHSLSDAYLSNIPSKRRRLITASKPQGTLQEIISEGVGRAILTAGVSSPLAERVIAEAGKDETLQEAYKEQQKVAVSKELQTNPDFSPQRFPNAAKHFTK